MTERLLQFIWQQQYFNKVELNTQQGESLVIIHPGNYNTHQGPDFLSGRVRVGSTMLAGSIELHLRGRDWERHGHTGDGHYDNVILHVVWEDDGFLLPDVATLVLGQRVSKVLLGRYEECMRNVDFVPCAARLPLVGDQVIYPWLERVGMERLSGRSAKVRQVLDECRGSWDECLWRVVAGNFGLPRNADLFGEVAASLPLNLLLRHRHQPLVLEALLLGQAGLLDESVVDSYTSQLKREYAFYRMKYGLKEIHHQADLLRMRPPSFPSIRLSQLAVLLKEGQLNMSLVRETDKLSGK